MIIQMEENQLQILLAEAIQRGIIIEEKRIHKEARKGSNIQDILVNRGFRFKNDLIVDNHSKEANKESKLMLKLIKENLS